MSSRSLVVLEKNRVLAARIARVLSASAELSDVHQGDSPSALRSELSSSTVLVALDVAELDTALEWLRGDFPQLRVLTWGQNSLEAALQVARHEAALQSIVAWAPHQSMPRAWELALATRRAFDGPSKSPKLQDLLTWGATTIRWQPRNSAERDHAVAEVERYAAVVGTQSRLIERLALCAHELLMNAMYDAPIDANGKPLYAHDRKQEVILDDREAPTLRLGIDGMTAILEATDPFGRLERIHVLGSILRGLEGARSATSTLLDTSHGGAGLGFFRLYTASTALIVEVRRHELTRVTVVFDLDGSGRQGRGTTASLHLFAD